MTAQADIVVLLVPRRGGGPRDRVLCNTVQIDSTIQQVLLQPVAAYWDHAWSSFKQTTKARVDDTVECWVLRILANFDDVLQAELLAVQAKGQFPSFDV
jgi:hypothetical protein